MVMVAWTSPQVRRPQDILRALELRELLDSSSQAISGGFKTEEICEVYYDQGDLMIPL